MSKKATKYSQCRLEKTIETGTLSTVTHLPAKHAVLGKVKSLKDSNGSWSHDWVVKSRGCLVDEPPDPRQLIKGHRKMTGDSTPKATGS